MKTSSSSGVSPFTRREILTTLALAGVPWPFTLAEGNKTRKQVAAGPSALNGNAVIPALNPAPGGIHFFFHGMFAFVTSGGGFEVHAPRVCGDQPHEYRLGDLCAPPLDESDTSLEAHFGISRTPAWDGNLRGFPVVKNIAIDASKRRFQLSLPLPDGVDGRMLVPTVLKGPVEPPNLDVSLLVRVWYNVSPDAQLKLTSNGPLKLPPIASQHIHVYAEPPAVVFGTDHMEHALKELSEMLGLHGAITVKQTIDTPQPVAEPGISEQEEGPLGSSCKPGPANASLFRSDRSKNFAEGGEVAHCFSVFSNTA